MQLRLTDVDLVGRLIAGASEKFGADIDGPRWCVSAADPARYQAAEAGSGEFAAPV